MTTINIIPVSELTDQHLIAEYREITMVPAALTRTLNSIGVSGLNTYYSLYKIAEYPYARVNDPFLKEA